jgi:hypothetical protein
VEEKPKHFRNAEAGGEADEDRSPRKKQGGKVAGNVIEVRNTIQTRKVRQGPIEQYTGAKLRKMFGAKKLKPNFGARVFGLHALPCSVDHLLRCVAGNHGNVMTGKKERVFSRAAIDFQDMGSWLKDVENDIPYSSALGTADHGARKQVVIPGCQTVKSQDCLILNIGDGHASTSATDESMPARVI